MSFFVNYICPIDLDSLTILQAYNSKLYRRILVVYTVILLLVFIPAQQNLGLVLQPEEAVAQQTLGKLTDQKIPVDFGNSSSFSLGINQNTNHL